MCVASAAPPQTTSHCTAAKAESGWTYKQPRSWDTEMKVETKERDKRKNKIIISLQSQTRSKLESERGFKMAARWFYTLSDTKTFCQTTGWRKKNHMNPLGLEWPLRCAELRWVLGSSVVPWSTQWEGFFCNLYFFVAYVEFEEKKNILKYVFSELFKYGEIYFHIFCLWCSTVFASHHVILSPFGKQN